MSKTKTSFATKAKTKTKQYLDIHSGTEILYIDFIKFCEKRG